MVCPFIHLNVWAILTSVLTSMALGSMWYSPLLFGTIWLKLVDHRVEGISREEVQSSLMLSFIPSSLSVFFLALLLAWMNVQSLWPAMALATLISLGFVGMSMLNLVFFEGRSYKLVLLNLGYTFFSLNLTAVILTLWR